MRTTFIGLVLMIITTLPASGYSHFIKKIHPDIPEQRAKQLSETVVHFSDYYGIPSDVVLAVIWRESQFINTHSAVDRNPCSSGYMQIQRTTASQIYHQELNCKDLINKWRLNIQLGVKYLRKMYDKTSHLAGAIGRYNGIHNLDYVLDVLNKRQEIIRWRQNHEG
jgi:soluble lytic murein transglycosylase-like protein